MTEIKKEFDAFGFFRALEGAIIARQVNWKQVSEATGVSTSTLSRMKTGRQPDAASLATLSAWSGVNPADFVRTDCKSKSPETLALISQFISNDPNLSRDGAAVLDEMVKAAYQRLAATSPSIDTPPKEEPRDQNPEH
jgi:transcriptional regulator with XRE-family HTH domain